MLKVIFITCECGNRMEIKRVHSGDSDFDMAYCVGCYKKYAVTDNEIKRIELVNTTATMKYQPIIY